MSPLEAASPAQPRGQPTSWGQGGYLQGKVLDDLTYMLGLPAPNSNPVLAGYSVTDFQIWPSLFYSRPKFTPLRHLSSQSFCSNESLLIQPLVLWSLAVSGGITSPQRDVFSRHAICLDGQVLCKSNIQPNLFISTDLQHL